MHIPSAWCNNSENDVLAKIAVLHKRVPKDIIQMANKYYSWFCLNLDLSGHFANFFVSYTISVLDI